MGYQLVKTDKDNENSGATHIATIPIEWQIKLRVLQKLTSIHACLKVKLHTGSYSYVYVIQNFNSDMQLQLNLFINLIHNLG